MENEFFDCRGEGSVPRSPTRIIFKTRIGAKVWNHEGVNFQLNSMPFQARRRSEAKEKTSSNSWEFIWQCDVDAAPELDNIRSHTCGVTQKCSHVAGGGNGWWELQRNLNIAAAAVAIAHTAGVKGAGCAANTVFANGASAAFAADVHRGGVTTTNAARI